MLQSTSRICSLQTVNCGMTPSKQGLLPFSWHCSKPHSQVLACCKFSYEANLLRKVLDASSRLSQSTVAFVTGFPLLLILNVTRRRHTAGRRGHWVIRCDPCALSLHSPVSHVTHHPQPSYVLACWRMWGISNIHYSTICQYAPECEGDCVQKQ